MDTAERPKPPGDKTVKAVISEAVEDFEWTNAAVKLIGRAPKVEAFDTGATGSIEAVENSEDGKTPEEPQAVESEETEALWEAGKDEDEESASSTDFEEESGVSDLSLEDPGVDTVCAQSPNKRLPCVVVVIDGREAVLILRHTVDGFVTVKFLNENDDKVANVGIERVRLLRVDDGQDK